MKDKDPGPEVIDRFREPYIKSWISEEEKKHNKIIANHLRLFRREFRHIIFTTPKRKDQK